MNLVGHILKKDIGGLRWEILATVALTLATALFEWPRQHGMLTDLGQIWSQPAMVLAWILLVLRVVQRDGLVGTEHDWLTRPVRRWQVAAAKALFVALFAVVPVVIRDAIVVAANGFSVLEYLPGMVWSLGVWIGVFLLPAAALGAVTRTIPQALMCVVGLVLLSSVMAHEDAVWQGVGWVPMGLAALLIGAFAGMVAWLQYSRRWTVAARMLGVAGVAAAAWVAMLLPWGAAFFVQRLLATETVDASTIAVTLGEHGAGTTSRWPVRGGKARVHFPVEVTAAPAGYRLRVLRLEATAGTEGETIRYERLLNYVLPEGGAVQGMTVEIRESEFVTRAERPARLRGRVYVAVLAPRAKQDLTFRNGRQMVPGVGSCEARFERFPVFQCRAPFRTPVEARVTIAAADPKQGRVMAMLGAHSNLSPLPFEFSLAPLRGVAAAIVPLDYSGELTTAAGLAGGRITYETWVPVAYIEREFDVTGRSLGDYRQQ